MNGRNFLGYAVASVFVVAAIIFAMPRFASAQESTAEAGQVQDLTGYWVQVVTEDWRYRMVVPRKGDYQGVPLNADGHKLAEAWDPAKDTAEHEQCKSYGAAAIMRVPERIHIDWEDPNTLRVQTDAGMQTRLFHFGGTPPVREAPSWQGYSVASWEGMRPRQGFGFGGRVEAAKPEGYLKVVTTDLRPGYLRKNGVPYSKNAVVEEYFDSFTEPDHKTYLVVSTVVTDPTYLQRPFLVSSQFEKLSGDSGWHPTPCQADAAP